MIDGESEGDDCDEVIDVTSYFSCSRGSRNLDLMSTVITE